MLRGNDMKLGFTDEEIMATPMAASAGVFYCPDLACQCPHLLLLDADNKPIAHYIIGDEMLDSMIRVRQRRRQRN